MVNVTFANVIHPALSSLLDNTAEFACKNITAPYGTSECCKILKGITDEVKCLPHFIIAGAQKSGTTALSAFMTSLPYVSFSPRKEVHFYDKERNYKRGKRYYLESFYSWNFTDRQHYHPPMFAESTPFYLASRDTPGRMVQHLPNVKLIFLLREPVSRAWSEYHMKQRRVESQNSFLRLASQNSKFLYDCIVTVQSNYLIDEATLQRTYITVKELMRWSDIKECIAQKGMENNVNMSQLFEHHMYEKFVLSFNTHIRNKMGFNATKFRMGFTHAVNTCFGGGDDGGGSGGGDNSKEATTRLRKDNDGIKSRAMSRAPLSLSLSPANSYKLKENTFKMGLQGTDLKRLGDFKSNRRLFAFDESFNTSAATAATAASNSASATSTLTFGLSQSWNNNNLCQKNEVDFDNGTHPNVQSLLPPCKKINAKRQDVAYDH